MEKEKGREGKGRKENRRGEERRGGQAREEKTGETSRMCKKGCLRLLRKPKKRISPHTIKPLYMSENVRHSVTFRIDTMAYKHFITTTSSTTTTFTTSISRFFSFSTSHRRVIHSSIQLVGPSVRWATDLSPLTNYCTTSQSFTISKDRL